MDPDFITAVEIIVTVTATLIAFIQHRQKQNATATGERAEDHAVRALAATAEAQDREARVVSFFDPADQKVTSAPAGIPVRSYTMADETKRWLTFVLPAGERQSLLEQIDAAEKRGLAIYTLEVAGAWYAIEYGLVKSSGKKIP